MKKYLFGLLMVIGATLMLTACGGKQDSPTSVVEAYSKAVLAEDYEAAFSLCCKADKSILTPEEVKKQAETVKGLALMGQQMDKEKAAKEKVKSIEVISEKIDGETAKVKTKNTKEDGTTTESETTCLKVDGKWYVVGAK